MSSHTYLPTYLPTCMHTYIHTYIGDEEEAARVLSQLKIIIRPMYSSLPASA